MHWPAQASQGQQAPARLTTLQLKLLVSPQKAAQSVRFLTTSFRQVVMPVRFQRSYDEDQHCHADAWTHFIESQFLLDCKPLSGPQEV